MVIYKIKSESNLDQNIVGAFLLPNFRDAKLSFDRSDFPLISDQILALSEASSFAEAAMLLDSLKSIGPFEKGMRVLPKGCWTDSPDEFFGEITGFVPVNSTSKNKLSFLAQLSIPLSKAAKSVESYNIDYIPLHEIRPANSFPRSAYPQFSDEVFSMPFEERVIYTRDIIQLRHLKLGMNALVCRNDGTPFSEAIPGRIIAFIPDRFIGDSFSFSALLTHNERYCLAYAIQHLQVQ
ncbi:MAG: hypothetical protein GYA55_08955 [SAR324 cluster bacterium]|uniref:Uncharacterized protein n=1 Tax=SAR324 cluster bacterium TaxID=2024889 RepID=A0A7X9IJN1_9DELT|nr:hypothetical protein [SAR324 cluster bacterium]